MMLQPGGDKTDGSMIISAILFCCNTPGDYAKRSSEASQQEINLFLLDQTLNSCRCLARITFVICDNQTHRELFAILLNIDATRFIDVGHGGLICPFLFNARTGQNPRQGKICSDKDLVFLLFCYRRLNGPDEGKKKTKKCKAKIRLISSQIESFPHNSLLSWLLFSRIATNPSCKDSPPFPFILRTPFERKHALEDFVRALFLTQTHYSSRQEKHDQDDECS